MPPKKNKLPDGWFNCPKYGELIQNKFMALKTPLSKNFDTKLPPEKRFYPQDIFNVAKSKGVCIQLLILSLFIVFTTFRLDLAYGLI